MVLWKLNIEYGNNGRLISLVFKCLADGLIDYYTYRI
jgi:hypothetical protein